MVEHFYQNIHGWFTFPILYKQVVQNAPESAHFVEVGSWLGKSSAFMAVEIANSGKNIKFDCVDTWEGSPEHKDPKNHNYIPELSNPDWLFNKFLQNMSPVNQYYMANRTDSLSASCNYDNGSLDFIFIDAAHDYDSVKADIEAWLPKLAKNGVLAGHDYYWFDGVQRAVNELIGKDNIRTQEGCWIKL